MSSRPLRFLQAGDFLLHQPLDGLPDVPDHLVERLVEAPYRAAAAVFGAALAEDVDFVLLTGNLCVPHRAGPCGFHFLSQQFARLTERGIGVYWAAGEADRRRDWPAHWRWPSGVHVFAADRIEHVVHHREGKPLCQIAGRSADGPLVNGSTNIPPALASFAPGTDGLFAIAVLPGALAWKPAELVPIGNHYWACSGSRQVLTALAECDPPCVVHSAGMPQGRSPRDLGPHGCTLVQVESEQRVEPHDRIRLTPITTDTVRWHDERIVLTEGLDRQGVERLLQERMRSLIDLSPKQMLLIQWAVDGIQSLADRGDSSTLAAEWLAMLRSEFGFLETPAWSMSLTVAPPEIPAAWTEQETLVGDFLRRVHALAAADGPPDQSSRNAESASSGLLDCFLSEQQRQSELARRSRARQFAGSGQCAPTSGSSRR